MGSRFVEYLPESLVTNHNTVIANSIKSTEICLQKLKQIMRKGETKIISSMYHKLN